MMVLHLLGSSKCQVGGYKIVLWRRHVGWKITVNATSERCGRH